MCDSVEMAIFDGLRWVVTERLWRVLHLWNLFDLGTLTMGKAHRPIERKVSIAGFKNFGDCDEGTATMTCAATRTSIRPTLIAFTP